MPKTPKNSIADYAIACNFHLDISCRNQRQIHNNFTEDHPEFLDIALSRLKDLVDESLRARQNNEKIPLSFEIYDADLYESQGEEVIYKLSNLG